MICNNCGSDNPKEASFCMSCGSPLKEEAAPADPRLNQLQQSAPQGLQRKMQAARKQLSGERKPVTILFTDIVGSTAIAETMDPEDWREVVAGVHQLVSEAIYRYEGTITQLLGDGVYAFFGAPITHEDDPERAVLAALQIQEEIYRSSLAGAASGMQMRVGINTGEVVIGDIGTDMHVEYLAFGDAVNVAARLESAADPGAILISESTFNRLNHKFEAVRLAGLRAKGKSEALTAFQIVGHQTKSVEEGPRKILDAPLIGRDSALAMFKESLEELGRGHGGIVFLVGDAGLGKSRLMAEVRRSALAETFTWVEGRCQSYETRTPYRLWTTALSDLIGLDAGSSSTDKHAKLKKYLERHIPKKHDEILPLIQLLFGWADPGTISQEFMTLTGEDLQAAIFGAVETFLAYISEAQSVVLVCEDLHWADPTSIKLFERVVGLTSKHPLLLVGVLRPESDSGAWRVRDKVLARDDPFIFNITLKPLTGRESESLIQSLLTTEAIPDDLKAKLRDRSDGNPFYIEESLRALIDAGEMYVEPDTGVWRIPEKIDELPIGDSLHAVLLARIDRLPSEARQTLNVAAVLGRRFTIDVLRSVVPDGITDLTQDVGVLVEREFLRRSGVGAAAVLVFKQQLTKEVAYSALLKRDRRDLHAHVGNTLERLYDDELSPWFEQLAYQYLRAEDWEKAWTYNRLAGLKAKDQYANEEAIGYLQAALALVNEVESISMKTVIDLTIDLAQVQSNINQYDNSLDSLNGGLSFVDRMTSEEQPLLCQARLNNQRGQVLRSMGEFADAEKAILEGLSQVDEDCYDLLGPLKINLASVLTRKGEYTDAQQWCQEGIRDLEKIHDVSELAHAYSLLGTICRDLGDTEGSFNHRVKSLELSESVESLPLQVEAHNNLAVAYYDRGNYGEAVRHYQLSSQLSDRMGNQNTKARAEINLGEIKLIWGEWDDAERSINTALEIWERKDYLLGRAYGSCILGELHVHREKPELALESLSISEKSFIEMEGKGFLPKVYRLMAEAHCQAGEVELAQSFCRKALDLAEELEMAQEQAVILRVSGRLCMQCGDLSAARKALNKSISDLAGMQVPYEHALSLYERALLARQEGRGEESELDLQDAASLLELLNARVDLQRVRDLLEG